MPIFKKPALKSFGSKKQDMPEGLWHKCPSCGEVIHEIELKQLLRVCPHCNHHFRISAKERALALADQDSLNEFDANLVSKNPLNFTNYDQKIDQLRRATGMNDAVLTCHMTINGFPVVAAIMDFQFFAGSMGSVVGEKITRAIESATSKKLPIIIFSASSGARMQEGMFSLMQMAKTSGALARHHEAKLPYISILTDPTTGGVTASFATLGDIIIAEPKCMIGFAGPRVIRETTHQTLPDGFQTAEFMLRHGLVDMIVSRRQMRDRLGQIISLLSNQS